MHLIYLEVEKHCSILGHRDVKPLKFHKYIIENNLLIVPQSFVFSIKENY